MKSFYITALLLFPCTLSWSQTNTIIIRDSENLEPLANIAVFFPGKNTYEVSTTGGKVTIPDDLKEEDNIVIDLAFYEKLEISYGAVLQQKNTIYLKERVNTLEELVVSANRFEEKRKDVAQSIDVIKAKEIATLNVQTTADLLQQTGNILVQKSQSGGGSPIMRGFEGNKVLMVVDGIRMNNAIYRGGHLQNSITVDNNALERVELAYGAGSVIYGSDALGGVIHFRTLSPELNPKGSLKLTKANGFGRFSSVNNEQTTHLDYNIDGKKWAHVGSITYSDFGDLRMGAERDSKYPDFGKRVFYVQNEVMKENSSVNVQKFSGYTQVDLLGKVLFKPNERLQFTLNTQYSTSSNIPRYDRLSEINATTGVLSNAQWYYGPQERLLLALHTEYTNSSKLWDKIRFTIAYQNIAESRHNRRFGSSNLQRRLEQIDVYTLNLDVNKIINNHEIRYGFEFAYNQVNSKAYGEKILSGVSSALDTRYPNGGSQFQTSAVYLTHTWEISPKWILSAGLRYSKVNLNAYFKDKTFFTFPFERISQESSAFSGNIGLIFMPDTKWRMAGLFSTGFRAPNVDDLSKVFESTSGNLIVPNPNLRPEYTYNLELNVSKYFGEKVLLEASAFYTWFREGITTQKFQYNGQDSVVYNGRLSRVTANVNAQKAYIYGVNARLTVNFTKVLSLENTTTYTFARIQTDSTDYPLDHIPPLYGRASLVLNLPKFRAEFYCLYNGAKLKSEYNVVGEDNFQYATADGMPAWHTLNIKAQYQINKFIQVQTGIENITDQHYRVFASGFSGAGRNFFLALRARI